MHSFTTVFRKLSNRQLRRCLSTNTASPTASSSSLSTSATSLDAVAFIDLAFLESLAHNYGVQLYGPNYTKKLSLDLAPLLPFLAESVSNKFDGRSIDILRTYAYGIREDRSLINNNTNNNYSSSSSSTSSSSNSSPNEPGRFNFIRAAINERFPVRAFSGPPSSSGILSSISMTADIVHSAAIHPTRSILKNSNDILVADIDNGTPVSLARANEPVSAPNATELSSSSSSPSSVSNLKPFDIVICISSFRYLPAMVRAAQHGKSVFLATSLPSSSSSSSSTVNTSPSSANPLSDSNLSLELWNNAPSSIQNLITRLRIEDVLPQIIRPASDFRTGAPSLQNIALRIAEAIAKESGNSVAGNRLLPLVMDISKDLSRHRLSIKALVSRFPNAFSIEEQSTKYWVKLRPNWRSVLTAGSANENGKGTTATTYGKSNDAASTNDKQRKLTETKKESTDASVNGKAEENSASSSSTDVKEPSSTDASPVAAVSTELTSTTDNTTTPAEPITTSATDASTEKSSAPKKRGRKPQSTPAASSSTTASNNPSTESTKSEPSELQQLVLEANKYGIVTLTDESSKKALARPVLQQIARTCLPTLYRSSMNKGDLLTLLQSNMDQVRQTFTNRTMVSNVTTPSNVPSETVTVPVPDETMQETKNENVSVSIN